MLKDVRDIIEKNFNKYQKKTIQYNTKLQDEYEYAMKVLEDNIVLVNKLNAEIEDLRQEADSMVKIGIDKLKKKDEEFLSEIGLIKSSTAVYVARLNMLEEFIKQEKMLQQKCFEKKEKIGVMKEMYETELKIMVEKFFHSKEIIQKEMLTRCVNFAIHLKKQSLSDSSPGTSTADLYDLKDMLKTVKKQNNSLESKVQSMKEDIKEFKSSKQKNQIIIDRLYKVYSEKKKELKKLQRIAQNANGLSEGYEDKDEDKDEDEDKDDDKEVERVLRITDMVVEDERLTLPMKHNVSNSSESLLNDFVRRMDEVLSNAMYP